MTPIEAWYSKIDSHLTHLGFRKSQHEPTLYLKQGSYESILILSLYVDDLLITGNNEAEFAKFKREMKSTFEMTNLGLKYFLGLEVT